MINRRKEMSVQKGLEDCICETYEVLQRVASLKLDVPEKLDRARAVYLANPSRFDADYVRVKIPQSIEQRDYLALVLGQLPRGHVTILDVGCFDGDFFTADAAKKLGEKGRIIGIDRFSPKDFNESDRTRGHGFCSVPQVLDYVDHQYSLPNLSFRRQHITRNSDLRQHADNGSNLVVVSHGTPDMVNCFVGDSAREAGASLIVLAPVGTGKMDPHEPESSPRSRYLRQPDFSIKKTKLHALLNTEYKMTRDPRFRRAFTPASRPDRFHYQLNMLAKQLVMLDRARHFQEHDYTTTIASYGDGLSWGSVWYHHILTARRQ